MADQAPCPCCKAEDFDTFEDKRLRKSLYALKVRCTNKKKGCEWEGELGQLEEHLNANPPNQILEQLEGCQFVNIKCVHCSDLFRRSHIQAHQNSQCPSRPTMCMYCDKYCSNNEDVTTNHWSLCAYYPVHCPNRCGKILQRQDIAVHVSSACPLAEIDCDFKEVGCQTTLLRKEMVAHLSENVMNHLSLMASSHSKLQTTVAEQDHLLKNFELNTERLQQRTVKLNQALETVKQNAITLQQKLSKRDEHLTLHLKALQQQLAEETKRSRREDAKVVKMVKQHLLDERQESQKTRHKFPIPGVVVLIIVSMFLLYAVIQPLKGQHITGSQPYSELPVCILQPLNFTLTNKTSVYNIEVDQWYCLPSCTTSKVNFRVNSDGKAFVHLTSDECNNQSQTHKFKCINDLNR